jgi:hypothetical protein
MKLKTMLMAVILLGLVSVCGADYTLTDKGKKIYDDIVRYTQFWDDDEFNRKLNALGEEISNPKTDLETAGKIVDEYIKRDQERKKRFKEAAKEASEHCNDKEFSIEDKISLINGRISLIEMKLIELFGKDGFLETQIQNREMK